MIRGEHPEDFGLGEVLQVTYRKHPIFRKQDRQLIKVGPGRIPTIDELDYTNYDARLDFLHQASIGQAVYRGPECETFIDNEVKLYDYPEYKPGYIDEQLVERNRKYRLKKGIIPRVPKPKGYQPRLVGRQNIKRLIKMGLVPDEESAIAFLEEMKKKYATKEV